MSAPCDPYLLARSAVPGNAADQSLSCTHHRAKNICLGQEIEVRLKGPGEAVAQFLATQLAHVSDHFDHLNFAQPASQVLNSNLLSPVST